MNKLNKLKEVIQKANPSILDIKSGCKTLEDNGICLDGDYWAYNINGNWSIVDNYDGTTVLGREITLADVLIAIEKKGLNDQIEYYNILMKLIMSNNRIWNLTQDLDHQSEEVIDFLYDILVN